MDAIIHKRRVLVIDDDEIVCNLLEDVLCLDGFDVIVCHSGEEGIAKYQELGAEVDLVLCDMYMPSMSGQDTIIHLKEINPQVKVILLSGFNHEREGDLLPELGIQHYIAKPIHMDKLRQTVRLACARYQEQVCNQTRESGPVKTAPSPTLGAAEVNTSQLNQQLELLLVEVIAHKPIKVKQNIKLMEKLNWGSYRFDFEKLKEFTRKYQYRQAELYIRNLLRQLPE